MSPTLAYPAAGDSLRDASALPLALRRARIAMLQAGRLAAWIRHPDAWKRPAPVSDRAAFPELVYERAIRIRRTDPGVDPVLDEGKAVNLALAAPRFDGLVLGPDAPLSFWRVLGRCTAARGFRLGAEVRAGCVVPTLGGGLCLLSNALFVVACELGWTIIERHGHTAQVAPDLAEVASTGESAARGRIERDRGHGPVSVAARGGAEIAETGRPLPWGLDATVLWPHVDLRVAPRWGAARLGVRVIGDFLHLRVEAARGARRQIRVELDSTGDVVDGGGAAGSGGGDGARWRSNQILRSVYDRRTGALIARDVVAHNRRRLLSPSEQRRSCLSCGETACRARPRSLPRAPASPRRPRDRQALAVLVAGGPGTRASGSAPRSAGSGR